MKKLYSLFCLMCACCVFASVSGIQGKVTSFGIFRFTGQDEVIKTPETSSGVTRAVSGTRILVSATNVIPAKIGLRFGFTYEISNVPASDGPTTITKVVRHPRITKPDGTKIDGFTFAEPQYVQGGRVFGYTGYGFDHDYELVVGDWEFELQYSGKIICTQKFVVVKD